MKWLTNKAERIDCKMRHDNGNCLPIGGFCAAVNSEICHALHEAYGMGKRADQYGRKERINPNINTCVCCGAIIPEGLQVCPICLEKEGISWHESHKNTDTI